MHTYEVGKLYTERANWPELAQYNYRGGEHELVLFLNRPTSDEIQSVRRGRAEFALFVKHSLIILLYRFDPALPWSDAPYSIHLVPPEQRTVPARTSAGQMALLHIVLVDASSGITRALRVISMPPDFTQVLHKAIQEQAKLPFTRSAYNGELEALYQRYPSADLAKMAAVRFSSQP
jgi:hypothetical protein